MTMENVVVKDMLKPRANFMCLQGTKMSEMINTTVLHYWRPIILNKRMLEVMEMLHRYSDMYVSA